MENSWLKNKMKNIMDNSTVVKEIDVLKDISLSLKELNAKMELVESNTRSHGEEARHVLRKDTDKRVNVSLTLCISRIEDIDTVKQEFTCEFFLAVKWEEPNLKGRNLDVNINWNEEWDPRISFENMVEVKSLQCKHLISKENVNASEFPVVQLSYRVKGRFKSVLNLSSFPFDYQTLTVIISSKWSEAVLQFNDHDPSYISVSHFPDKEEWELGNSVTSNTESTSEDNFIALSYSSCHFSVQILRKFSYFLYNIALLMFIITILCFVSFSIESSAVGDKLSVCLTLLLTAVAFKFVVSGSLPPVSYLTILDKYVLSCILFIFLITIVNSVAGLISNKTDLKSFLWYSFYAAIGLFVIMHAIFGVMSVAAVRSRRQQTMLNVRQTRQGKQQKGLAQVEETRISILELKPHKQPSKEKAYSQTYVNFVENESLAVTSRNEDDGARIRNAEQPPCLSAKFIQRNGEWISSL